MTIRRVLYFPPKTGGEPPIDESDLGENERIFHSYKRLKAPSCPACDGKLYRRQLDETTWDIVCKKCHNHWEQDIPKDQRQTDPTTDENESEPLDYERLKAPSCPFCDGRKLYVCQLDEITWDIVCKKCHMHWTESDSDEPRRFEIVDIEDIDPTNTQ